MTGLHAETAGGARLIGIVAWVAALPLICVGCGGDAPRASRQGPVVSHTLPWHDQGVWLHGDIHTHYLLQKEHGPQIMDLARAAGLDFVVSTEHSESAFDDEAAPTLALLREQYPDTLLLAGIEWNVPGADHASVIVERSPQELTFLEEFAERFDRKVSADLRSRRPGLLPGAGYDEGDGRGEDEVDDRDENSFPGDAIDAGDHEDEASGTWGHLDDAARGLRWLAQREAEGSPRTVVYLNHPGRRYTPTRVQFRSLFAAGLNGVAAAPGHQRKLRSHGAYTRDRHEPMVMRTEGVYDTLLAEGIPIGIAASSDYHASSTSYSPGAFSRTLVFAPKKTSTGVLAGLAAGATATVLGRFVTSIETRTTSPSLDGAALVGETLAVAAGSPVVYSLLLQVPAEDFQGQPNRIDRVEVISNLSGAPAIVASSETIGLGTVRVDFSLPPETTQTPGLFYLRARGRRVIGGPSGDASDASSADFMFHIGPTWVRIE